MAMVGPEPRVHPLIDLDIATVRAMLSPMNLRGELVDVVPATGGLVNTVYRVTVRKPEATYGVRIHAGDVAAFEREVRVLSSLQPTLVVPHVLLADASGTRCAQPYAVHVWIEGATLNQFRRDHSGDDLLTLAAPLGELLARIARTTVPPAMDYSIRIADRLRTADGLLGSGLARSRLGEALADAFARLLHDEAERLLALDERHGLVHGDFGGRNVLVRQSDTGAWEVSGVLDWDCGATGSPMWDVGSLFRYHHRYSPDFRDRFADAYREAGGALLDDWWQTARLLDATRLVGILNEDRDLPTVFAECRELIEQLTFHDRHASAH
jgi:aminoglycoside phosphotransferase (APT) family kinase protein